jgi:hypothetical protein
MPRRQPRERWRLDSSPPAAAGARGSGPTCPRSISSARGRDLVSLLIFMLHRAPHASGIDVPCPRARPSPPRPRNGWSSRSPRNRPSTSTTSWCRWRARAAPPRRHQGPHRQDRLPQG